MPQEPEQPLSKCPILKKEDGHSDEIKHRENSQIFRNIFQPAAG
jgi:hypothetical protein